MKKIIFLFSLLVFGVNAFAQYPAPTSVLPFKTALFFYKISGSDTITYAKDISGNWYPIGRASNLIADAKVFKGLGTTSNKFSIRDTVFRNNFIIRSDTTGLPALTLISGNTSGFVFRLQDLSGVLQMGISGQGTIFSNEFHAVNGQKYGAFINQADSGWTDYRNAPNGYFMKLADSSATYAKFNRYALYNYTDSTHMGGSPKAIPTVEWVLNRIRNYGGGGGGGNTIYSANDSLVSNRIVKFVSHKLEFGDLANSKAYVGIDPTNQSINLYTYGAAHHSTYSQADDALFLTNADTSGYSSILGLTGNDVAKQAYISVTKPGGAQASLALHAYGVNVFTDAISSKGIVYANNYGANFTDRSLVDKRYVDSVASSGGGGAFLPLDLTVDATVTAHGHELTFNAQNGAVNTTMILDSTQLFLQANAPSGNVSTVQIDTSETGTSFTTASDVYILHQSKNSMGIYRQQNTGSKQQGLFWGVGTSNMIFRDSIKNIGALFSQDYSTNQRLNRNAIASIAAVIALADSVKGTISGGVTSVSGTTNRVTSTGGSTPVIDISSTFEALLGKVANPLSQFASTTSSQLAGVLSDETGSGSAVFATSPTLVTPNLGTPSTLTLTNATGLPNSGLINSSTTINGTSIALGASGTVTANTTNSVTFNNGGSGDASGTAFNGGAARTISYNTLGASPLAGSSSLTTIGTIGSSPYTTAGIIHNSVTTGAFTSGLIVNADITNSTIDLTSKVTGILPIANGGTGAPSVTTAPTASAWVGQDANKNYSANSFLSGYTTTATAAGTTTLTVGSTALQYFTGSTTQTVVMPVASTLVLNQQFTIVNNSTGLVTVNSSGGNLIFVQKGNTSVTYTCILTSGTTAASWNETYQLGAIASNGNIVLNPGLVSGTYGLIAMTLDGSGGFRSRSNNTIDFFANSVNVFSIAAGGPSYFSLKSNTLFGWSAGDPTTTGGDVYFGRNGVGIAEVNNGSAGSFADLKLQNLTASGNITIGLGKELKINEGTNGFAGQTTLVSGTKAITITGVTTSSRAIVTLVSQGGTVTTTTAYAAVCTSNTLTITALTNAGTTDTTDTSVLNYMIIN